MRFNCNISQSITMWMLSVLLVMRAMDTFQQNTFSFIFSVVGAVGFTVFGFIMFIRGWKKNSCDR